VQLLHPIHVRLGRRLLFVAGALEEQRQSAIKDFVIRRSDGSPLYNLAVEIVHRHTVPDTTSATSTSPCRSEGGVSAFALRDGVVHHTTVVDVITPPVSLVR
jgi:hypothetical protein